MNRRPARRRFVGRIRVSGEVACIFGQVHNSCLPPWTKESSARFSALTLALASIVCLREYERVSVAVKSFALGNLRPVNERNNHSRQQHGRPDSNGVLREEMGHLF